MKNTKKSLFLSLVSLLLCCSMLVGTTFAWFTDSVRSGNNRIVAGNLDVTLEYYDGQAWTAVDDNTNVFEEGALWEPGHTEVVYLRIGNAGTLALDYKLGVNIAKEITSTNVAGEELKLSDHILMGAVEDVTEPFATREAARAALDAQAVSAISAGYAKEGSLYPANAMPEGGEQEKYVCLVVYMPEEVGNEANYKTGFAAPEITLGIDLLATQQTHEQDSFDDQYDYFAGSDLYATQTKTLEEGSQYLNFVLTQNGIKLATIRVPADAVADPAAPVTASAASIAPSQAALEDENTQAFAYDIHVSNLKEELTEDQMVTVTVYAPNALAGMKAYHNGQLIEDAVYNEVAGTITFKTASFSPFDFTTQEYAVSTLADLREKMKIKGAYIKLTDDLTIDLSAGSEDRSEDHTMTTSSGSKYYNAVNVVGEDVAIDLNGHNITVKCSNAYNGNQDVGALFFVGAKGSLNITNTGAVSTGFIKMASSIYAVWAPYADPSYVDIYDGAFIADSYAGDPIGTPVDSNGNYDPANGSMSNENSNRALIYAGFGGNMNVYGGYFLYNNTPNDTKDRNNGAFNAKDFYEESTPLLTIHEGVMLSNKEYRQNPANTSQPHGSYDNYSVKLAKDCDIAKVDLTRVVLIDGKAYSSWYSVIKGFNSISAKAKMNVYDVGYEFSEKDFQVNAFSANGTSGNIDNFTISQVDTSTPGAKTVTVTYATENITLTTTCTVSVLNLCDTSNTIKAPGAPIPVYQQFFNTGNFNVSGWANLDGDIDGVKVAEPSYANMVGKTFKGRNGEIATGFNTDIVNGTYGENYYDLTITNAKQYTTLGINCLVAYNDTNNPILGFGCYIDDNRNTLTWNSPAIVYIGEGQAAGNLPGTAYQIDNGTYNTWGKNNAYALTTMSCDNLKAGQTYTIHWVVVFEDGLSDICEWTVKMADLTSSDAMFEDTGKPNANVIIMAGQSNMFGPAPLTESVKNAYGDRDFSNVFIKYNNINIDADGTLSTHFSNKEFEKYRLGMGAQGNSYFGPELGLANVLANTEALKGEKWFVVKYAPAGTALGGQWTSGCVVNGKSTTLTDDMLAYVQTAIDELSGDYDVHVRSFVWMQGESDACNKSYADNYAGLEKNLVERVRNRFAAYATRTVGSIPGSGISFVNAGIADNDLQEKVENGGPNDWVYSSIVNAGKISNSQWLCSVPGSNIDSALTEGPLKGYTFGKNNPTIPNPNQSGTIVNSIYFDTHDLLSKALATNEHPEYAAGDRTDWAHYSAGSMLDLGNRLASGVHYLMTVDAGPVQHKITFEADGGNVEGGSEQYAYIGEKITLPAATKTGYTFTGWYTAATDGELIGRAGDEYLVKGSAKLYARWEVNVCTVTYNANGGTCNTTTGTYNGTELTLPTATRTGYTFNGWYTAASGGTKVGDAGATYTPTADITLYAQWTRIQYTVTYEANGGSVSTGSVKVNAGDGVELPTPTRDGYTFKGWYNAASGGTKVGDAGETYMPTADITLYAQWTENNDGPCFTPDTLIILADGTQKRVDQLKATDKILAWDFFTGAYVEKEISLLVNHGDAYYKVVNLTFSDDSMLRIVVEHGIFDYDLNKFVYITADNMNEYVGHRFVKYAADGGYDIVTLTKAYETEEYTSAWSVSSAITSNAFASGLLTVAPPEDFYNWIEMGGKLIYNVEQFQKDVEAYGLYTYDDFKDYVTYEQFVAWNGAYLKVAVEKGYFTFEYILELIELYKGWMT